jgi:glycine oxidase
MATSTDIAIIGGGIIGLTAAVRLRQLGCSVAVFDRGEFGREASWAGAGILPPGDPTRTTNALDHLRALGAVLMPEFATELRTLTSIDNGYRRNGAIEFLEPREEYAIELWRAEGIRFERLTRPHHHEPMLRADLESSTTPYLLPDMAQVRNPWHLRALIAACSELGVQMNPKVAIEGWVRDGSRIHGMRLSSGETRNAEQFLLAAGPWSERLLQELGVSLGVHPVRGQIVLLNVGVDRLKHTIILGKQYAVPRGDGRILFGSTEEPEAGFAKHTTKDGTNTLVAFASANLPGLFRDCERPGSPDGWPFIGRVPGVANVVAAVGHYRAGVQLSLGTARFVSELLTNRPTCVPLAAFALDRVIGSQPRPAFRS